MNIERQLAVLDLNARYAEAIDEGRLEEWPDFFTDDGRYRVTTAENVAQNLPLSLIYATSRAMLRDRVKALREANIYEAQRYRHMLGPSRIEPAEQGGLAGAHELHGRPHHAHGRDHAVRDRKLPRQGRARRRDRALRRAYRDPRQPPDRYAAGDSACRLGEIACSCRRLVHDLAGRSPLAGQARRVTYVAWATAKAPSPTLQVRRLHRLSANQRPEHTPLPTPFQTPEPVARDRRPLPSA